MENSIVAHDIMIPCSCVPEVLHRILLCVCAHHNRRKTAGPKTTSRARAPENFSLWNKISMAILSPTIRRSLYRVLAQQPPSPSSNKASSNALFVGRRGGFGSLAPRSIHSTCVLSGDALDMADTFSRRHGKHIFYTMLLCTNHRRINS